MFTPWSLRHRHPSTDNCTFLLIKGHFWSERIPFCQLLDYFCSQGWFMFIPGSAAWGNIITANDIIHKALCFSENMSKCKSTGIIHILGTHCGFRFAYMFCCRVDDNVRYWFSLLVVQAYVVTHLKHQLYRHVFTHIFCRFSLSKHMSPKPTVSGRTALLGAV